MDREAHRNAAFSEKMGAWLESHAPVLCLSFKFRFDFMPPARNASGKNAGAAAENFYGSNIKPN
ncbi:MAG: hypothetical protein HDT27_02995 [Subdoligranulum sp.]|nr:hypothetical protein [Subdoligranulum sp.]